MKKNVLDYMHLYKDCDIQCTDKKFINGSIIGKLRGMQYDRPLVEFKGSDGYEDIAVCKLILRPLSSMTESEMFELAKLVLNEDGSDFFIKGKGFGYTHESLSGKQEIHESVLCIEIHSFISHPKINDYVLTNLIQIDSDDFEIINGRFEDNARQLVDDIPYNQHYITKWMLEKGFDIFRLIPAGLATSKE